MKKRQGYKVTLLLLVMTWLPVSVFAGERSLDTNNLPSIGLPSQPDDSVGKARDEQEKARLKKEKDALAAELKAAKNEAVRLKKEKEEVEHAVRHPVLAPSFKPHVPVSPSPGLTFIDSFTGMEFVYVKGGCFMMGDTFGKGLSTERAHEVCVDDFWIGRYEVTQGEWEKVVGKNKNNSAFKKGLRYPVENVTWDEIKDFFIIEFNKRSGLKCRLPTEAEWEYAARSGGKDEKWAGTSDESRLSEYAWYEENAENTTHEVGTRKPNGLGLYDMSGNVWELCEDWVEENYYVNSPKNNPPGPSIGSFRVDRGGSWCSIQGRQRAAARAGVTPNRFRDDLGFRLVFR